MQRINLIRLNLVVGDLLEREQLKTVFGGYGSCSAKCSETKTVTCSGGNCTAVDGPNGYCTSDAGRLNC